MTDSAMSAAQLAKDALREYQQCKRLIWSIERGQRLLSDEEAGVVLRFMTGRVLLADLVLKGERP